MAEIEIGKLVNSGLKERIASVEAMRSQTEAYIDHANNNSKPIQWQFTNADARIKLKHLYPTI